MALVEGYPELDAYAMGLVQDNEKVQDGNVKEITTQGEQTPPASTPRQTLEASSQKLTPDPTTVSPRPTLDNTLQEPGQTSTQVDEQARLQILEKQKPVFALQKHLQKTKLCKYALKGGCKLGKDCRFAHGITELVQPPNLQKTRMCPALLSNGKCNNPHCTFAHHESDVKEVNLCHKTVMCTWYLAGKCRSGKECTFAHGEHELAANANANKVSTLSEKKNLVPPVKQDNMKSRRQEPTFVESSMGVPMPAVTPFQPPPGFMPYSGMMHGMQPYLGGYPAHLPMAPGYMPMPPPPMMPPFIGADVDFNGPPGMLPLGLAGDALAAPPPGMLPLGLAGEALAAPPPAPGSGTWQLTELAVQINMLSEEVKRLQDCVVPPNGPSTQSTNSGSSTQLSNPSSGQRTPPPKNKVPRAADAPTQDKDPRTFEEKLAGLQSELKRMIVEGERCGKIKQYQ